MWKPAWQRARSGFDHSLTSAASGYSASIIARMSRQIAQVALLRSSSPFTSESAMSTRYPSQPRSSQKRITSLMASRVASASGESVALIQCLYGSRQP